MNRFFCSRLLCFGLLLSLVGSAMAQKRPVTLKLGSRERAAVLKALRAPVQKELRQPVVFKVDVLTMQDGWAFMRGVPRRPGSRPVDYRRTKYQEARKAGAFDDWICALLRKKGGVWRVVTYQIGATDVAWADWSRRYKAPAGLFR